MITPFCLSGVAALGRETLEVTSPWNGSPVLDSFVVWLDTISAGPRYG